MFATGWGWSVPGNSELRAVYVAAEYGRRGVGAAILDELETLAQDAGLSELHRDASVDAVALRYGVMLTALDLANVDRVENDSVPSH